MNELPESIEGTWEEISREAERFNGHRLRVTILPNKVTDKLSPEEAERRLAVLDEWLNMPRPSRPPGLPPVDDSREGIYCDEEYRWR